MDDMTTPHPALRSHPPVEKARVAAEALGARYVDVVPVPFDWSCSDPDRWASYEGGTCYAENNQPDGHPTNTSGVCDRPDCAGFELYADDAEGPAMNYLYPLDQITEEDAAKIADLPLCVVLFDDGPPSDGLASPAEGWTCRGRSARPTSGSAT